MAGAPAGPPDEAGSPYASRRRSPPGTASSASRTRPSRRGSERHSAARTGSGSTTGRTRAAASTTRFASTASGRRCALTRPSEAWLIGDVPIYVAQGSVDHRAHPDLFLRARRRAPPDKLAARPALGQPALRLGRRGARRLPLVDRAPPAHARALRPDRIDHFQASPSSGRSRSAGRAPDVGCPGRARPSSRRPRPSSAPAGDRGGSRPDHARRARAARPARLPGHGRAPLGLPGQPDSPHRFENHREHQVIYTTTARHGHAPRPLPAPKDLAADRAGAPSRAALAMIRSRTCSSSAAKPG